MYFGNGVASLPAKRDIIDFYFSFFHDDKAELCYTYESLAVRKVGMREAGLVGGN